jgi:hypothetical protein
MNSGNSPLSADIVMPQGQMEEKQNQFEDQPYKREDLHSIDLTNVLVGYN